VCLLAASVRNLRTKEIAWEKQPKTSVAENSKQLKEALLSRKSFKAG